MCQPLYSHFHARKHFRPRSAPKPKPSRDFFVFLVCFCAFFPWGSNRAKPRVTAGNRGSSRNSPLPTTGVPSASSPSLQHSSTPLLQSGSAGPDWSRLVKIAHPKIFTNLHQSSPIRTNLDHKRPAAASRLLHLHLSTPIYSYLHLKLVSMNPSNPAPWQTAGHCR